MTGASKLVQVLRVLFAVAMLGSTVAYFVHQHGANRALADAPEEVAPIVIGGASVMAPAGFVRVTAPIAAALDETVTPAHYYAGEIAAHPLVLVRRDRGSDQNPDLAVIELDPMREDIATSGVTDADCAGLGQSAVANGATLVRTEVRAVPAGTSCLVQTVRPPRQDATTIVWFLVTDRSDYVVHCIVDPHRAGDLAACEAFGHSLRLM